MKKGSTTAMATMPREQYARVRAELVAGGLADTDFSPGSGMGRFEGDCVGLVTGGLFDAGILPGSAL